MINRQHYKNSVWVDLAQPTKEEIESVVHEFQIDPRIAHELSTPTFKPRVDEYSNCIYLVLHFPVFKHTHTEETDQEIDFILGKKFIITARRDSSDPLHRLGKILETEAITDHDDINDGANFIFFRMLKEIYSSLFNEIAYVNDWTNDIERKIFAGKEREMVISLSQVSRVLLDFKKAIWPHGEILESLAHAGKTMFGEHFAFYTKNIMIDYFKLRHMIDNAKDILSELRETNNSLLGTRQNEISKVIAVLAFIAVPLSLLVGIFQIDTVSRPIIGIKFDFWILVVSIFLIGGLMFGFFKYKKWL